MLSNKIYDFDFKNIPGYAFHNIKLNKNKSPFIYKLLRSDNMHNLIIDNIKLNDNTDDHFEELQRRKHNIFEENETNKNNEFFGDINNEKSLENKNKDLDNKLLSLYRLHSSKFHKKKDVKLKDDLLNMRLNLLKKSDIEKFNSKNKSILRIRQKVAFKYRFMNALTNKSISPEKKKITNFKKQNEKMNKILKISKSIPDVLYKEIKTMKTDEKNIKSNETNSESMPKNNDYGFNSSFKTNRYLGNIYDYYKNNIPLYLRNNNIFVNNTNINNNNNIARNNKLIQNKDKDKYFSNSININKVNKSQKDINKKEDTKVKYNKIKINKVNYGKGERDSFIKLSSLFT